MPGWAYFDVVTADTFNIMNASLSSNLHESTVGNVPTPTASISPTSGKGGSNTVIVGVTVGGVIGLLLLVSLVWFMIRNGEKGEREKEMQEKEKLTGQSSASSNQGQSDQPGGLHDTPALGTPSSTSAHTPGSMVGMRCVRC